MKINKKRSLGLRKQFSFYNFICAIVPVFLSAVMTFLLLISLVHMVYSDELSDFDTSSNSRDVLSMYVYQFNINEIERSVKNNHHNEKKISKFGYNAIKRLEKYRFNVLISLDDEIIYISDGVTESSFPNNYPSNTTNKGFTFIDDQNAYISDSTTLDDGKTLVVSVYYTSAGNSSFGAPTINMLQFSSWGYIALFIAIVAFVVLFNAYHVRKMTKKILIPIENLILSTERISDGNLSEKIESDTDIIEINELYNSFDSMRTKLLESKENKEEYERIRKDTYSGINHDSRTAITAIKGYTQGLIDGIANTPEKQDRYIKAIQTSTYSLEKLMDAFSEITYLDTNKSPFKFKKRDMYYLLSSWQDDVSQALEARGVKLHLQYLCNMRVFCNVDTFQMERVCDNILSNCIKYKKPENSFAEAFVNIYIDPTDSNSLVIRYRDNGIGISEDDTERIFDVFYRADEARSNTQDGNGIGLSVVKKIILMHNGTIEALAQDNGLELIIKLPIVSTSEI